jgi:hypothetical protein
MVKAIMAGPDGTLSFIFASGEAEEFRPIDSVIIVR